MTLPNQSGPGSDGNEGVFPKAVNYQFICTIIPKHSRFLYVTVFHFEK